jgi:hypothetical protein
MNCEGNIEKLVECARLRSEPGNALKAHLRTCERCLDRLEGERELSANIGFIRMESNTLRSSARIRVALMREFDARHAKVTRPYWSSGLDWSWGLAMAAALLLGVLLGPEAINRLHPARSAASLLASGTESAETQQDPDADGFIAVPYAPPLATGELVRIVHTELNPAALASLGVSVDPSWTTQLPADVLEGEDGMPRAVRVSEVDLSAGGF